MALLDTTELLVDPDFVDEMSLVTRVPMINSFGENTIRESSIDSVGSIQPASGNDIQRLPEEFRLRNLSTFWFKGTIVASSIGKYSSILIFRGQRYQVVHLLDWTNWGAGWSEGMCVAEIPAP